MFKAQAKDIRLLSVILLGMLATPVGLFAESLCSLPVVQESPSADTIPSPSEHEASLDGGDTDTEGSAQAAVQALVASRWNVDPGSVVLEWRESRGTGVPVEFSKVELVGSGRNGHWVVSFHPEAPQAARIQIMVRAGAETRRLVATRPLNRGEVLVGEDLRYETQARWGPPPSGAAEAEPGWIVQRAIRAGEPLTRPAVAPPKVVQSGQPVRIVWQRGTVNVTLQGKASGAAELGETIYVRTENGQRLRCVALGPGLVKVLDASGEEVR